MRKEKRLHSLIYGLAMNYKKILFLILTFIFLFFALDTYGNLKDLYFFIMISTIPISTIGEEIMQLLGQTYLVVIIIGYIGGLIQWVIIVGGLMDKFLPKINFNIK